MLVVDIIKEVMVCLGVIIIMIIVIDLVVFVVSIFILFLVIRWDVVMLGEYVEFFLVFFVMKLSFFNENYGKCLEKWWEFEFWLLFIVIFY